MRLWFCYYLILDQYRLPSWEVPYSGGHDWVLCYTVWGQGDHVSSLFLSLILLKSNLKFFDYSCNPIAIKLSLKLAETKVGVNRKRKGYIEWSIEEVGKPVFERYDWEVVLETDVVVRMDEGKLQVEFRSPEPAGGMGIGSALGILSDDIRFGIHNTIKFGEGFW